MTHVFPGRNTTKYVRKSPFGIYVADVTPVTCVYGLHLCLGLISDYVFKI